MAISTTIPAITHVAVTVTDLAVSEAWYTKVLGVEPVIDEDTGPFRHIREVTPIWDRPAHPYADQFGHEWAWHFEDDLQAMASAADGPEDFQRRITAQAERLGNRDLATNWRAFVNRKLAGVADPGAGPRR